MDKRIQLLGYYDYTVILTYCGMLAAFTGILMALQESYWSAVFCLMVAGICDMFDGAVAATKVRSASEKRFGIQIDSLSDLISFGVLPAVFTYMITGQNMATGIVCGLYVLAALIRLAYFNVLEEERQQQTTEHRKSYMGIPVTVIAVLLPVVYLMFSYHGFMNRSWVFPVLLMLMGAGFLSPLRIRKPELVGKICVVAVGVMEAIGMFFGMGWDMV